MCLENTQCYYLAPQINKRSEMKFGNDTAEFTKHVRDNIDRYVELLNRLQVPCGNGNMVFSTIIKETPPVSLYNYNENYCKSFFAIFKCPKCFCIKKVCLADLPI